MLDLSSIKRVEGSAHWTSEINQLYHPTGTIKQDSQDIVYAADNLNITKFIPILLKEWFYLVEKGGYLVIDYLPNKLCDFQKLEEQMWWLWKGKFEIIFHGVINKSDYKNLNKERLQKFIKDKENYFKSTETPPLKKDEKIRFICKKNISTIIPQDSINKWTFGIITNGKRLDWLEQIIKSIHQQRIPSYEIIVCGSYFDRKEKNFKYLPFNQRDDWGWITKKKNLIVKNARYENICLMHDRIKLNEDWYKGMKKWENCFEIIGCRQLYNGKRILDWITMHMAYYNFNGKEFGFDSHLDYRDWYYSIRYFGPLNIFKRSILTKNNLWWNENLYIKQHELRIGEEIAFSKGFPEMGFIQRFNPYASVTTLAHKYVDPTFIIYDPLSQTPKLSLSNLYAYLKLTTYLILKIWGFLHLNFLLKYFYLVRIAVYVLIIRLSPTKYSDYQEWKKTIREDQSIFKMSGF